MSTLVKATLLGVGLLAGVGFAAHAQSSSVASLPPASATPPAATAPVGPSAALPGPNPGLGYYGGTVAQQAEVAPSPAYVGPNPGLGFYQTNGTGKNARTLSYAPHEDQLHPYTANIGPRPN